MEQSDQGIYCFVKSYLSLYLDVYDIQHFKIMDNIPREKYFDMVFWRLRKY